MKWFNISKIMNLFINILSYSSIAFIGYYSMVFLSENLNKDQSSTYSYHELSSEYKGVLVEFEETAKYYGKDASKIRSFKFLILNSDKLMSMGFCEPLTDVIYLNNIDPSNLITFKKILFHELGHCIFNYRHKIGDSIMNTPVIDSPVEGPIWENDKKIFFTSEYDFKIKDSFFPMYKITYYKIKNQLLSWRMK